MSVILAILGAALGWYGAAKGHFQAPPVQAALVGAVAGLIIGWVIRLAFKMFSGVIWIVILGALAYAAYLYFQRSGRL